MINIFAEVSVVDETWGQLILVNEGINFGLGKLNIESAYACAELNKLDKIQNYSVKYTYGCFSDPALAELIEGDEEFFDSNSVLGDESLESFFDIVFQIHVTCSLLLGRRMEAFNDWDRYKISNVFN